MARASLRRGLCFLNVYFGAKKVYVLRDLYFSFTFFQTKLRSPNSPRSTSSVTVKRQGNLQYSSRQLAVNSRSLGLALKTRRVKNQSATATQRKVS